MSGINIPPSIFAASAPPFTTAAQPASTSEEGWKESKLKGLQSWQDMPPALSWQPDGSLPNSSTPMSDLSSLGLNSIASKQSLGERVSLASKQMALSVLDILATKPPGPVDSKPDRAGLLGADATSAASDAKADMHSELSVRDMPELAAGELPHPVSVPTFPPLLSASFSSLPEPPPPLQVAPLTDNRSPVPVPASRRFSFGLGSPRSAFSAEDFPPRSPGLRSHSLDPSYSRELQSAGRQPGSPSMNVDGYGRRTTRASTGALPPVAHQGSLRIEVAPSTPQSSGSLGSQAPSPTVDGGPSATSGRSGARRGRGPGVGEKRKSKKDDLRSKNREAQRRFREKQKAKLDMLEEKQAEVEHYRGRLERVQREYEERLHGTATELQRLQLEKTLLQVRESRIVDMVGQLNRARSQGVSAAERSALLDSITAEAGRVRSGREAETTASVLGKVLDYIKVDDFQGAESLQGHETRARVVEALKITSHTLQAQRSQEGTIVTVKDLINLPRESFLTLYTSCVREMVQLVKGCPNADPRLQNPGARFASDTERRLQSLVRETRALMCCFAAVDPREACLQQLRHTEDWSPVDQDADRAQCHAAWAALRLSAEQAEAIREAHSHFLARQRALAQQRCQALPYLQKALYSSCDLATHNYMGIHEAEAKVRGSMDEECDNICRLSCFVVSRVLTDWQVALLYVRTYPWAAHVMGIIETVVNEDLQEEPEPLQRQMSGGDMNLDDTV
ncbi:hypothetical protein CVIRNUC_004698 [Coccomyxa viridis]|uniref:BZIP domain-containing protein n=1 Tax=Coccomyxa viridis TaxID=1274662 RepID=A0AAV1I317_9CHLO|nr:hypothetical protein CVIRNUC_004698 [Coccomyxa viridis]